MFSEPTLTHFRAAVSTLAHLSAALKKRADDPANIIEPEAALRALQAIEQALDGAFAAAEWDAE